MCTRSCVFMKYNIAVLARNRVALRHVFLTDVVTVVPQHRLWAPGAEERCDLAVYRSSISLCLGFTAPQMFLGTTALTLIGFYIMSKDRMKQRSVTCVYHAVLITVARRTVNFQRIAEREQLLPILQMEREARCLIRSLTACSHHVCCVAVGRADGNGNTIAT